ncbi:hypothetical protein PMKS-001137 [Pichia membranifaciens]|uniref:Uncharacterized protein n=1 Tax=Pichia membranifaciens TaxID=4926 RepID=A0A1Q2YDQ1_9ASCO|nr:hypothetical protein PMKS-001137 [Pichia membranifaciens]
MDVGYSSSKQSRGGKEDCTQRSKSGGSQVLDDEEFLEIFGLPRTSIRSTASDTQQSTRKDSNSSSSFSGSLHSQIDKAKVIEIIDDPTDSPAGHIVPERLNLLDSELICIDDDDDDDAQVVEEAARMYPTSSPNTQINRSIDLIDLDDHEEPEEIVTEHNVHLHSGSNTNTSTIIDDSLSVIMNAGSVPLPFPYETPKRDRISASRQRANLGSMSSPIHESWPSSTSRRRIATGENPLKSKSWQNSKISKPATQLQAEKPSRVMQNVRHSVLNMQDKDDDMMTTSAKNPRTGINVFNIARKDRTLSSEVSEFSSSLNEIEYCNERLLTDEELQQKRKTLKSLKRRESNRVKSLISDLAVVRNKRVDSSSKYSKSVNSVLNSVKNAANAQSSETSEISNSSTFIKETDNNFMDNVTDEINLYTDERLEVMLERAKQLEPEKLKKVNQAKYTKAELTEKITCCFTNVLNEKLELLNKEYSQHLQPAHFEIIEDTLPIIRFKRYVDSALYKRKNTFVPIKPRQLFENFTILLYNSKDLIELFKKGIMKRHLNSIKAKYKGTKIAVWVTGYDQYLQSLKTKANRAYKEKVQQRLDPTADDSSKKKKVTQTYEEMIQPSHIKQKLLRYEVEHGFAFQSFKGLGDMLEWLKYIAYTLSSKYNDSLQRNSEVSNIGKVKSGETPKDCIVMMLSQIKGMTESRAKKFVDEGSYKSVAALFDDIMCEKNLSQSKALRTDHERLIKKIFLSRNENDLL